MYINDALSNRNIIDAIVTSVKQCKPKWRIESVLYENEKEYTAINQNEIFQLVDDMPISHLNDMFDMIVPQEWIAEVIKEKNE